MRKRPIGAADLLLAEFPRIGETAQLKVEFRHPDGTFEDVTASTGTKYQSLFDNMLFLQPEGRVTCVGSFAAGPLGFDKSSVTAYYGGHSVAYEFVLVPGGSGFSLRVRTEANPPFVPGQVTRLLTESTDGSPLDEAETRYWLLVSGEGELKNFTLVGGVPVVFQRRPRNFKTAPGPTSLVTGSWRPTEPSWMGAYVFARNGERVGWLDFRYRVEPSQTVSPEALTGGKP